MYSMSHGTPPIHLRWQRIQVLYLKQTLDDDWDSWEKALLNRCKQHLYVTRFLGTFAHMRWMILESKRFLYWKAWIIETIILLPRSSISAGSALSAMTDRSGAPSFSSTGAQMGSMLGCAQAQKRPLIKPCASCIQVHSHSHLLSSRPL